MDRPATTSTYVITVQGVLDARWATCFDGLAVSMGASQTTISGPIRDLSQLHGLLTRIHELGLTLIEVRRVPTDPPRPRRRS